MTTEFQRLNWDWNAEPNAPDARVAVRGHDVILEFALNPWLYTEFADGQRGHLRFRSAARWLLSSIDDHAWSLGKCRFRGSAPGWGEFYEVTGDLKLQQLPTHWVEVPAAAHARRRHFLFYLRDCTFECQAESFEFVADEWHDMAQPGASANAEPEGDVDRPSTDDGGRTRMRGVELHDSHPGHGLAFDLRHIVQCLWTAVDARMWRCHDVECTGDAARDLATRCASGADIRGSQLADLAGRVDQVIDGEFLGRLPGEDRPSLVIKAVDSTLWEVHGDAVCIDRLRQTFRDVRPAHPEAGWHDGAGQ